MGGGEDKARELKKGYINLESFLKRCGKPPKYKTKLKKWKQFLLMIRFLSHFFVGYINILHHQE